MITVKYVRERVALILQTSSDDPRTAHLMEDRLMVVVLEAVAEGHPDSAKLANITLQLQNHDYDRSCG